MCNQFVHEVWAPSKSLIEYLLSEGKPWECLLRDEFARKFVALVHDSSEDREKALVKDVADGLLLFP